MKSPEGGRTNKLSYHPTPDLPIKLVHTPVVQEGRVVPVHVQIYPTNQCSLKCSWCCCRDEDRDEELSLEQIKKAVSQFASLGCLAVTLSGGGDPPLHQDFAGILSFLRSVGLSVGLITNGTRLESCLTPKIASALTWIRVSLGDGRPFGEVLEQILYPVIQYPQIDWGLSYVLSPRPDWKNLTRAILWAYDMNLTHIKLTGDILLWQNRAYWEDIQTELDDWIPDEAWDKVVFQDAARFSSGIDQCWWGLARPVIGADGRIYSCCNGGFGEEKPKATLPEVAYMGTIEDIPRIWRDQKPFDGSRCTTCYFSAHNQMIEGLLHRPEHYLFI